MAGRKQLTWALTFRAEIPGELFHLVDTRVFDLPTRDLLDGADRHTAACGYGIPILGSLKLIEHVLMNRLHDAQHRPKHGPLQPTDGLCLRLPLRRMAKGRPKGQKYIAHKERRILTEQVSRRMASRYTGKATSHINLLAEESGVGRSTIQRIVDPAKYGSFGPTIDTLALLAKALRCEPKDLLEEIRDA